MLGPGNALGVFFFPLVSGISVVNIFVFGGSVSARRITCEYSIDDVTATWIEVNLASPFCHCCFSRALHSEEKERINETNFHYSIICPPPYRYL